MSKAERKAAVLLDRVKVERYQLKLPCDPAFIAQLLGYTVEVDPDLPPGYDGWIERETSTIVVAKRASKTRQSFTTAHELMHAVAPMNVPAEHLESYCDRGAAALLMPAQEFRNSGAACGWDLEQLREWWTHCSWNALVTRIADLVPGTAAAAWHRQQRRFLRSSLEIEMPEHADALEEFVACEALNGSGRSELNADGLEVRAWRSGPGRAVTLVRRVG